MLNGDDVIILKTGHCSYKCPYYQDGGVFSLCNKYNTKISYENYKPYALKECRVKSIKQLDVI